MEMQSDMSTEERKLGELISSVSRNPKAHSFEGEHYHKWDEDRKKIISNLFNATPDRANGVQFGDFGEINFPFHRMGAITSLELFGLDELILFEFYRINRNRYQRSIDIGANIGLHTIIMSLCGMMVKSYEPDPYHIAILKDNIERNKVTQQVQLYEAAVSGQAGKSTFIRVLGNTTGSHLKEAKTGAYGELEEFDVDVAGIRSLLKGVDLAKIDAEGEEARILTATEDHDWDTLDAVVEVGSSENAFAIFDHFSSTCVNLIAQKKGWEQAKSPEEIPQSYREGSLFITKKKSMPW